MRFGSTVIPDTIFALARSRMLRDGSFTPEAFRQDLVRLGQADLAAITASASNQRIIADRVMRALIKELVASGELMQFKRGLWMKPAIARA